MKTSFCLNTRFSPLFVFLIPALILTLSVIPIPVLGQWPSSGWNDSARESTGNLGDCTTAIIAGWATVDGRPLLWKNRDVSTATQEFHFYDYGPYPFVSITYAGQTDQGWGGVNSVGFAVEDANALNLPDPVPGPDDDGIIIYHALATCETVYDFAAYMDTTGHHGRTRPAIYGVFDRFGNAGMFECGAYTYEYFDANDPVAAPHGILVRSNYAYSGDTTGYVVGRFRHDRALELLEEGYAGNLLTAQYVNDIVARDIANEDIDPYPLPYEGVDEDFLFGYIHTHNAVNREISMSGFVAEGIQVGENPLTCTMWTYCGEPIMTPAVPLWVAGGDCPPEIDGDPTSPICDRATEFFDYLYLPIPDPDDDLIDTWKLIDDLGKGLLSYLRDLENSHYDSVNNILDEWRISFPSYNVVSDLQDSLATVSYEAMMSFNPPLPVENLTIGVEGDSVRLSWPPVDRSVFLEPMTVDGYCIYTSDTYFLNRISGDSLCFTEDTTIALPHTGVDEPVFFQVRAVKY